MNKLNLLIDLCTEFHGVTRWQNRVWSLVTDYRKVKGEESTTKGEESTTKGEESTTKGEELASIENEIFEFRNLFLKDVS